MFLAIDVGNTQTTVGLFDCGGSGAGRAGAPRQVAAGPALVRRWRMATDATDTADELHARLFGFFRMFDLSLADVGAAAVASVVPALTQEWQRMLRDVCRVEPLVVDASHDCGIPVRLDRPHEAGADRIANALAARATYGAPVIVVDFGTATNIDVVDAAGAFRGGAIMPGLTMSARALFARTARLASVPLEAPPAALGTTTERAVQSGLVLGAAAAAEGLVARIQAELAAERAGAGGAARAATVVGTGGLAPLVAGATELFDAVDADLTLRGIFQIWEHCTGRGAAGD